MEVEMTTREKRVQVFGIIGLVLLVSIVPLFSSGTQEKIDVSVLEQIKQRGVIRNGIDCGNPPGEYYNPKTDSPAGFSVELSQMLADYIGVELELVETDWAGVIPSLYTKEFDFILSSMTITEERKNSVAFSNPYGCDQVCWIVRKDDKRISSPADLDGKIVTTQLNSASEIQAIEVEKEYGIKYAELKSFDYHDGAYREVAQGKADVATSTVWNNLALFDKVPNTYDVAFTLPYFNYVAVAVRQEDTELLEMINEFITSIQKSGELADLQEKYYGYGMDGGDLGPNLPENWNGPTAPPTDWTFPE